MQKAFEILNADPKVKTILVNIFGGIMRCDVIAAGILSAAKTIGMKKPIVSGVCFPGCWWLVGWMGEPGLSVSALEPCMRYIIIAAQKDSPTPTFSHS